jgi:hypothetical protein
VRLGLGKKQPRTKTKKTKYNGQQQKKGLWWTPFNVEWRNVTHPMDRTMNWCIGGYWFVLAYDIE